MKLLEYFKSYKSGENKLTKPFLIAEAGVNHEGSMATAKRLITEAAQTGAGAIKFQTYKAEKIAIPNSPAYWDTTKETTTNQFDLFKKYDSFGEAEYVELKKCCDKAGIEFLSTPFDTESATFLNNLVDAFKISSSDITNLPFIEFICRFGKPIILSTGASNLDEIKEAVGLIESYKLPLCLMHCILNYPTENKNANLGMLLDIRRNFPNAVLGYSDHTYPQKMESLIIANLMGAVILEKHFTHDKSLPGNDHYQAMDKEDIKYFCNTMDKYYELIGSFHKKSIDSEEPARKYARRSIVAACDIKAGSVIKDEVLTWKRPGHGISPKYINDLLGKVAKVDIKKDDVIDWNMVE